MSQCRSPHRHLPSRGARPTSNPGRWNPAKLLCSSPLPPRAPRIQFEIPKATERGTLPRAEAEKGDKQENTRWGTSRWWAPDGTEH